MRQAMVNFGDAQYVSYMTMGKQVIAGILDTGSFELVVFGSDCTSCGVAAHYNQHLSETFQAGKLFTQQNYGSGGTICAEGWEHVSIGPYPASKQMFWNVQRAQMPILGNAAFEAVIGVGPSESPLAEIWDQTETFINNVTDFYEDGQDAPVASVTSARDMVDIALHMGKSPPMLHNLGVQTFSVCMGAEPGSDGVFIWDDNAAQEQPDLFTRVPVTGKHTWAANLSDARLTPIDGGDSTKIGCEGGCEAIIDSGTSLLAVPSSVIHTIEVAMTALDKSCSNLDVLPDLVFNLGGQKFSLPPSAYVAKMVGDVPSYIQQQVPKATDARECSLMLMDTGGTGMSQLWILGVPFFRKYYTTFNLGGTLLDRAFYIARHGDDECSPSSLALTATRSVQKLRNVEANRVHLPPRAWAQKNTVWTRQ